MTSTRSPILPQVAPQVPGLEDDEAGSRVVSDELRLLAVVGQALRAAHEEQDTSARGRRIDDARLLELRDDVAVAKPEDLPALFDQMHAIGALRAQRGKGAIGVIDRTSPYFGHLSLEESGKRRDVLIGSKSYVDSAAGIRIVDWRNAPVSRIFYRYAEGEEYEEQLGGRTVEGVVVARRSVAVAKGELVRVACPQGTFVRTETGWARMETRAARLVTERKWGGAGAAPRLGPVRQDKLLPAIASLLDKEQFDLVANPNTGLIAVQGSAGSGKTTVGLHRVAYLAFADPQRFRPDKMLVVVPHDALMHYVGRVLPELGVAGVPVVTFARYAARRLATLLPKLPSVPTGSAEGTKGHSQHAHARRGAGASAQPSRDLSLTEDTPPVVSRAKSHPAMLGAMDAIGRRVLADVDARVREQMPRWPSGDEVVRAWEATGAEGRPSSALRWIAPDVRVTALSAWLAGKRKLGELPPASALPDVTRGALERLGHELRQRSRSVIQSWDELLLDRGRLAETFAGEKAFGPGQLDQVHAWCVRRARLRTEGERDGELPSLDTEDVALLLRLWQILRGPLTDDEGRPIRYSHVFIDEVQDASPIELRVLVDLAGPTPCVTLAGDVAQRMFADGEDRGEFDWGRLLEQLGLGGGPGALGLAEVKALEVSYRSTAEITTFARGVLGPLAHQAEPIATRAGPPVELFTFASPGEAVAWLADVLKQLARDEPYANVALIARFPQHAELYYEGLARAEVPSLRRVAQQDFTWDAGFDVTDVRQTKGLEFDEVVLLETTANSYPDNAPARHALYVGATRAAHQLWCVASEAPSRIVTESLPKPA